MKNWRLIRPVKRSKAYRKAFANGLDRILNGLPYESRVCFGISAVKAFGRRVLEMPRGRSLMGQVRAMAVRLPKLSSET
ncbi:MAG: hypothetical protein WAW73_19240 [Rhodoferax sp.]